MADPWNALLDTAGPPPEPAGAGPLRGRTFVVKDVFDVAGSVTGAGSPALRARSAPAARSSSAVLALAAAGASYRGRSRSDELAFSLGGVNDADGTPLNPAAPDRTPGGSSSGSAAAVAGGVADIGLGTDTAGSIRVPASYCGLVGMRPTHGRVPVDGLVPLAPSYDTVGWLTRDGRLAADVGRVLLPRWRDTAPPRALLLVDDLLPEDAADRDLVVAAWRAWAAAVGATTGTVTLGDLDVWATTFHVLRAAEAWREHGEWLDRDAPPVSPAVAARIRAGGDVAPADIEAARRTRAGLLRKLVALLDGGAALVVPASAVRAPLLTAGDADLEGVRSRTLRLTAVASLAGVPSVAVPCAPPGDVPFGVALIGGPGDDESLLAAAAAAPDRHSLVDRAR
ncbi:MAG: amidase [Frankiaceae bacterium]|nr:amidase [Frankiaceae bacterium]